MVLNMMMTMMSMIMMMMMMIMSVISNDGDCGCDTDSMLSRYVYFHSALPIYHLTTENLLLQLLLELILT